jgi:histidinol-phosphatase (PHP family)
VIVDYHMHLRDSQERIAHRAGAIPPFVEIARERGVDEIGFTEHVYYFRQTREIWSLPYQTERCVYDLDAYVEAVLEAKRQGLPVKLGLEVDWWPPHNERLAEILEPYPWDYLLGSVHWIDGLPVDVDPGIWAEHTVDEVWSRYFAELAAAARSGFFDVMAHPDLVKIFDRWPERRLVVDLWYQAVEAIKEGGVAVEVSTAGLRKPVGQIYPDHDLLYLLYHDGVPITLASDAHVPELVGHGFDQALALLDEFDEFPLAVYDRRERREETIA